MVIGDGQLQAGLAHRAHNRFRQRIDDSLHRHIGHRRVTERQHQRFGLGVATVQEPVSGGFIQFDGNRRHRRQQPLFMPALLERIFGNEKTMQTTHQLVAGHVLQQVHVGNTPDMPLQQFAVHQYGGNAIQQFDLVGTHHHHPGFHQQARQLDGKTATAGPRRTRRAGKQGRRGRLKIPRCHQAETETTGCPIHGFFFVLFHDAIGYCRTPPFHSQGTDTGMETTLTAQPRFPLLPVGAPGTIVLQLMQAMKNIGKRTGPAIAERLGKTVGDTQQQFEIVLPQIANQWPAEGVNIFHRQQKCGQFHPRRHPAFWQQTQSEADAQSGYIRSQFNQRPHHRFLITGILKMLSKRTMADIQRPFTAIQQGLQ